MVSDEELRTIVGITGNIICLFFLLSPVPTFVRIWKKGSVERYSAFPYLAALMSCLVWTLYSLPMVHPGSTLILTISASGVAIESIYIILFLIFSDNKKRLKVLLIVLLELFFTVLLATLALTNLVHTQKKIRSLIVGFVCVFFGVVLYSSPLAVVKLVISTKSVEYMPFFLSFASFMNSFLWTSYALIRFDPVVLVPNGLGTLFGLAQMILHAVYYKSTKQLIAERKGKEVNLPDVVLEVGEDQPKKIGAIAPEINGHDSEDQSSSTIITNYGLMISLPLADSHETHYLD